MTFKAKAGCFFIVLLLAVSGYYSVRFRVAQLRAEAAEQQMKSTLATLQKAQSRQRDVASLDGAYIKELINARNTIEDLRRDIAVGAKRLRLNATCKRELPRSVPPSGVDDAASPELTGDARQAYFRLREELTLTRTALTGLQQYVQKQCLR